MKKPFLLCILLTVVTTAIGAEVGESYELVLQNQGQPTGKMQTGKVLLLNYPGEVVRIEQGKVVSVKAVSIPTRAVAAAAVKPNAAVPTTAQATEAPAELVWLTDYAGALAQAKKQGRKTFLFFTGSDWCTWCARLDREVLSTNLNI